MKAVLFLLLCSIVLACSQPLQCYKSDSNKYGHLDYVPVTCQAGEDTCFSGGHGCFKLSQGFCSSGVKQRCAPTYSSSDCCCNTHLCNPPSTLGGRCYYGGKDHNDPHIADDEVKWCYWGNCYSEGTERTCYGHPTCREDLQRSTCTRGDKCCCNTELCNTPLRSEDFVECYIGNEKDEFIKNKNCIGCEVNRGRWMCDKQGLECGTKIGFQEKCDMEPRDKDWNVVRCCCKQNLCNKPKRILECYVGDDKHALVKEGSCAVCEVLGGGWNCSHGGQKCGTTVGLYEKCDMDAGETDTRGNTPSCCCKGNLCNEPLPDETTEKVESSMQYSTTMPPQMTMPSLRHVTCEGQPTVLPQACTRLAGLLALIIQAIV